MPPAAARAMASELRWPGFRAWPQARPQRRRCSGPVDHLDDLGVPLWRDGAAPLSQTLYFPRHLGRHRSADRLRQHLGRGVRRRRRHAGAHRHSRARSARRSAAVRESWQIGLLIVAAATQRPDAGAFAADGGAAAAASLADRRAGAATAPCRPLVEMWEHLHRRRARLNDLTVAVSPDGSTLYVEGSYGLGSEDAVRRALDAEQGDPRPSCWPARRAGLRRLRTLPRCSASASWRPASMDGCASACTIAFLGGVERSISPGGRLGFHRASFPGIRRQRHVRKQPRPPALPDLQRQADARVRRPGVRHAARLRSGCRRREELLAGRVINRVNR